MEGTINAMRIPIRTAIQPAVLAFSYAYLDFINVIFI